ncbi:unnamed protein product [Allacma fusca]|uniref:Cytochrome b5 heme-binding domain-containing protein n=1 Tax=Allacma fusca TaxID=39272 RepID=A0A8J2LUW9_9HEXA|nr:unnamed protein product [Allacma fusca]
MGFPAYPRNWARREGDPRAKYVGPSGQSSFPRLLRSSEKRDRWYSTPESWLRGKIRDDNIDKNLWRVHDKLYNLKPFIPHHPGGFEWLKMTQGMDITELVENTHVVAVDKVEAILETYYVKDAPHPRNSPYTFEEHGFYKTLKKNIRPVMKQNGTGPTWGIRLMQDFLVTTVFLLCWLGVTCDSSMIILLAGIALGMSTTTAHNFLHIRDNWRKYYFDLSLSSHYEWRIEHVFSHHVFPNTALDVEILWLHPFLEFLSNRKKSQTQRFKPKIYFHLVYALGFHFVHIFRIVSVFKGEQKLRVENLLPWVELLYFLQYTNGGFMLGYWYWCLLHMVCSYWVTATGLNAAHHHPICFHDGDEPRPNPDYGLCVLDATCVKIEDYSRNLFQIMTTFGDHNLHHLFPAICISKIHHIKPIVEETVKEFNEQLIYLTQGQLHTGMLDQLARNRPHSFQYDLEQRQKTQEQAVWTSKKTL